MPVANDRCNGSGELVPEPSGSINAHMPGTKGIKRPCSLPEGSLMSSYNSNLTYSVTLLFF